MITEFKVSLNATVSETNDIIDRVSNSLGYTSDYTGTKIEFIQDHWREYMQNHYDSNVGSEKRQTEKTVSNTLFAKMS